MAKRKKPTDPKIAERRAARKAARQAQAGAAAVPPRPFEGLPSEVDWVAMREVVPAASADVRTTAEHGRVDVKIVTLLPQLWPALKRSDGVVLVALQTVSHTADPSRDVATALLKALEAEPGTGVEHLDLPETGPRLQDVLDLEVPFEVTVHSSFDYAIPDDGSAGDDAAAVLEEAAGGIVPTVKIAGIEGGYWCRMGEREFLRWARPEEPETLLDALARLHADRASALDEGSRFVGAFRSCGLLVPVWELASGTEAADIEGPATAFAPKLAEALAVTDPLTGEQRRARAGLVSRQVSLR